MEIPLFNLFVSRDFNSSETCSPSISNEAEALSIALSIDRAKTSVYFLLIYRQEFSYKPLQVFIRNAYKWLKSRIFCIFLFIALYLRIS